MGCVRKTDGADGRQRDAGLAIGSHEGPERLGVADSAQTPREGSSTAAGPGEASQAATSAPKPDFSIMAR